MLKLRTILRRTHSKLLTALFYPHNNHCYKRLTGYG